MVRAMLPVLTDNGGADVVLELMFHGRSSWEMGSKSGVVHGGASVVM